jgi:aspartate aminotransferase
MQFADRLSRVAPSGTLKVAAEADRLKRQGADIVDLGAGEPDFATPEPAKDAGVDAIHADFTKYTQSAGIPELRQAVCDRYRQDYGVTYADHEVIITAGGKQALYNVAMALFNPGDEVITHAPFWPTIPEQVKLADARPVIVRAHSEDGFAIHGAAIVEAITPRTKAIVINSPCNPTGALIEEGELAIIADAAGRAGIWVIVDLCYERLIYDATPHNIPRVLGERLRDRAVLCGSASKAYAMTGWRCGWAIGPAPLIAACNALQGHSTSNVASVTQKAVLAALTGSQAPVAAMLEEYRKRRDNLHAWLSADPRIECARPAGAFYMFPRIAELLSPSGIRTSIDFAQALLTEKCVAVTPGEAFDAPGYIRLSYATSMERLREGATRILAFARALDARRAVTT